MRRTPAKIKPGREVQAFEGARRLCVDPARRESPDFLTDS